jgi:hypothetical protein
MPAPTPRIEDTSCGMLNGRCADERTAAEGRTATVDDQTARLQARRSLTGEQLPVRIAMPQARYPSSSRRSPDGTRLRAHALNGVRGHLRGTGDYESDKILLRYLAGIPRGEAVDQYVAVDGAHVMHRGTLALAVAIGAQRHH